MRIPQVFTLIPDYRKQVGELSFDRKIQIKMYPGGGYVAKIQKK